MTPNGMISTELARALRDSGLVWHPAIGDAFRIDRIEVESDLFFLSDMTVEAYEFPSGTVIGFNGTTEWALDSVALDDALWIPREDQLRELLRAGFTSLVREHGEYIVSAVIEGEARSFSASDPAEAYGKALLALIDQSLGDPLPDLDDELPTI